MCVAQVVRELPRCLFCFLQVFFFMFGSVMPMNIADQNAVCLGRKLKVSNLEHE